MLARCGALIRAAKGTRSRTRCFSTTLEPRERLQFDVVVVGAGPAGLSAAIRLKQKNPDVSVCVLEKGAAVGSHILSGCVFNPKALNELLPEWKDQGAPLSTPVSEDHAYFLLNETTSVPVPVPPDMHNDGNYIISLGQLCSWLGSKAEELGVEVYPGFAASELVMSSNGEVLGVATADMGVSKSGEPRENYARGVEVIGKQTLLAEGCRGSLSEEAIERFDLRRSCEPQAYGIGLKEVWEIDPAKHKPGLVVHTAGYPLDWATYGGSFLYHMKPNLVLYGMVIGLDYKNPYLSPYEEFQRLKLHPRLRDHFGGGNDPSAKCISYGARALNEGGYQSIPKLTFPGGALIGCSAGFLNMPQIKGSHYAMKSGMLAADAVLERLSKESSSDPVEVTGYETELKKSWIYKELKAVRNVRPASKYGGLVPFMANFALESYVLRGRGPWTIPGHRGKSDSQETEPAAAAKKINYPKPDGKLTFDLLTNLARSGTNHEEDQPSHLRIKPGKEATPAKVSHPVYGAPETRFCPAKVYEYVTDDKGANPKLVINAQNCLHCKTCSVKMPEEYIKWTVPEGGGGPNYENM